MVRPRAAVNDQLTQQTKAAKWPVAGFRLLDQACIVVCVMKRSVSATAIQQGQNRKQQTMMAGLVKRVGSLLAKRNDCRRRAVRDETLDKQGQEVHERDAQRPEGQQ